MATSLGLVVAQRSFLRDWGSHPGPARSATRCLDEFGVCFVCPQPSPRNEYVMPVRLGFPTIFNLLGPLTNPVQAGRQLMGVYGAQFLLGRQSFSNLAQCTPL